MSQKGFSLVELLVAVTIIGILAAVAIPNYSNYTVESKLKAAHAALMDTRTAFEQSYMDNKVYTCSNINLIQASGFTTTCNSSGQAYTLTAAGNNGTDVAAFTFTVNEQNSKTSSKGAVTNNGCWATKANGSC